MAASVSGSASLPSPGDLAHALAELEEQERRELEHRHDLERMASVLEAERSATAAARQEAILATKKLSEARAAVKEEAEGRIRAERAHEEDARQWDSAAQSLRGTIQELHDKYAPPRDLDRLRAELQQELEAPHAERVASLEAELEATRELLSASRRRFEALKAEFEAASASHANEAEARADAHRRETAELSAQVLALQEELDAAAADTSAREAKSRAAAAEARLEAAEAELEAARGAAAEAEGARERSAAEAAASKAEAEVAVADARRAAAAAERSRAAMTDESHPPGA
ncbi:hypothetical protein FNF28_01365 [Cafeteria roenbergensis]|uniref:Uncharacterized protein n=1 Tax=Cafeteria roenbergensis TaxID=33653 RepID=A0A5A8DYK1_CAFRO|nr:hypothetical protein FNF28_01365 [Cafeteria roenbergensis]